MNIPKIALIDSEVNILNNDYPKTVLLDRYIIKNKLISKKAGVTNSISHGTAVLNNIVYECNELEILAIEVLDVNNKGKMYELIRAIEFCILKKVSLINISLGIVTENDVIIQALKTVCQQAIEKGIIVVAASNNDCMKQSYPAAFDFVISVSSSNEIHRYCIIDSARNDICFCFQTCLSKYEKDFDIYAGNSYLCGYVSGLICSRIEEIHDVNGAVGLLKQLFMSDLTQKLFVDPYNDMTLDQNISFIYFEDNSYDCMLRENLNHVVEAISWLDFINTEKKNKNTIFFGSTLLPVKNQLKTKIEEMLLKNLLSTDNIILFGPMFNTKERKYFVERFKVNFRTVYI